MMRRLASVGLLLGLCGSVTLGFSLPIRAPWPPDGRTLAVSQLRSTHVELLDASDLSLRQKLSRHAPGVESTDAGELVLAWSQGGSYLYGAGRRLNPRVAANRVFKWTAGSDRPQAPISVSRMRWQ